MKIAMVGFEALVVWAILQLLAARGLPSTHVLLYAWHPLPLWEFARSGHIDAVAIAFLMLALVAADRRSPVLAGIALGAGALVKYFPVVAGPSLYQRWDWRLPVAFVATVAVLYLPYLGAGTKVFGFLGQYIAEERIDQGSGIFLWLLLGSVLPLPANALSYLSPGGRRLIMIALALALVLRERKPGADLWGAMVLAVTFLVLFSPHYAWYFAWLVPFLCFYPSRRRALSDLRGQLALHRALAAAALRRRLRRFYGSWSSSSILHRRRVAPCPPSPDERRRGFPTENAT